MRKTMRFLLSVGMLSALGGGGDELPRTPAELYPGLFEQVQLHRGLSRQQSVRRRVAESSRPKQVMKEYRELRGKPGFDLQTLRR